VNVRVTMDGELLTDEVNGRALPVDPGVHEFSLETDDGVVATRRIVIMEGRRNRKIAFSIPDPNARDDERDQSESSKRRERRRASAASARVSAAIRMQVPAARAHRVSSLPGFVVIGAGVLGIGGYGVLSYWGRKDNDLLARCSPDCAKSDVDHIHTLYLAADVSLGVGVTALLVGSWMVWRSHSTYTLDVRPTDSGAIAAFGGAF
jgi:hypothetical protein